MHKPESVLENRTHEIFRDFEVQTDHQILARRPDLVLIKRNCRLVHFSVSADDRLKIKVMEA